MMRALLKQKVLLSKVVKIYVVAISMSTSVLKVAKYMEVLDFLLCHSVPSPL